MTYSFTGLAYTFFTLAFSVFCWRLYQYWQKERSRFTKFLFLAGLFFLFFSITVTFRIFFFNNTPFSMGSMIALGALFQTIAYSFLTYCFFIVKIPKISPWVATVIVFFLGFISSFMAVGLHAAPYIDSNNSLNWGFENPFSAALVLRGLLSLIVFIAIMLLFAEQFKESRDSYSKRKSLGFLLMFLFIFLVFILDFFFISIFKLKPIWKDAAFIVMSFTVIFINFLSFKKPDQLNKKMIKKIKALEILDSKGNPTVKVELSTDKGVFEASIASGSSTGKHEALELRDGGERCGGKGVLSAIKNIEEIIAPELEKKNPKSQKEIDELMIAIDGTDNKSKLGGNAILPVSMAFCRAGAAAKNISLFRYINEIGNFPAGGQITSGNWRMPKPSFNMIEGGKHAKSGLGFQEFMIIPQREIFKENLEIGVAIYKELKEILSCEYGSENVGLSKEGAFDAPIKEITEALDFILKAAGKLGLEKEIKIAIDAAASEFYNNRNYSLHGKIISTEDLSELYKDLVSKYPIASIEDPFYEEDFDNFSKLRKIMGEEVIILGDDLTTTNIDRIKLANEKNACSGLILKPNQIGTVTETIEAAKLAKSFGWKIMVSNRAGETQDDFIADLAVGVGAEFIKSGAPFPKERMAKYNRLVRIEEELGAK
jgi:enolase